ncbi:GNAT family N-acetyltransferase [Paenibacillus sp. FSL H7-0331]|uniref:GNAT family N-acetyltransferase n=1 Tax=Paenibacillus sp. FSL H7-0331 TaxID=1920421 RepID=UPI002116BF7E|nr:GNAT family protein [Paenibacillus sp. FSL H7-0331]
MIQERDRLLEKVTLTGKRVKLVPLEQGHVQGLFDAGNDQQIWTYLPSQMNTLEHMNELVLEALEAQENGLQVPFTIMDVQTNDIMGSTRFLNISLPNKNLEIGWTWYSPKVWRTHVNTECKYLLLRYGFEELGLIRIQFRADVRNVRSNTAILRIGAKHEGTIRKDRVLYSGFIRDTQQYSILDEEWPEVKVRLETQLLRVY